MQSPNDWTILRCCSICIVMTPVSLVFLFHSIHLLLIFLQILSLLLNWVNEHLLFSGIHLNLQYWEWYRTQINASQTIYIEYRNQQEVHIFIYSLKMIINMLKIAFNTCSTQHLYIVQSYAGGNTSLYSVRTRCDLILSFYNKSFSKLIYFVIWATACRLLI